MINFLFSFCHKSLDVIGDALRRFEDHLDPPVYELEYELNLITLDEDQMIERLEQLAPIMEEYGDLLETVDFLDALEYLEAEGFVEIDEEGRLWPVQVDKDDKDFIL